MRWFARNWLEIVIVIGIGLVGYGCYLIWLPLAPLSVGGLLLLFALVALFAPRKSE